MAAFGAERLKNQVAYLATVSDDGRPRVHPVGPILGEGHLFVYMEPTSPKAYDLKQNGLYALHSSVRDVNGSNGEFIIRGRATLIEDPETRTIASNLRKPKTTYILFDLGVDEAIAATYVNNKPTRNRWKRKDD